MSLETVRKSPYFKLTDLIVYALLVVLIVGLLIFGLQTRDQGEMLELLVYRDEKLVFSYSFEEDKYLSYENVKVEKSDKGYLVTVYTGDEFNLFEIDKAGSVNMLDASCSLHKDCVAMWPIHDKSGVIICTPHHLKLCASDEIDDPILG